MSATAGARELPASAVLMQMLAGKFVSRAISVAADLGIADLLREGERSTAYLAAAAGAHEPSLYRLMRALASVGIFTETAPRTFALTPVAECLRSDAPDSLRAMARFFGTPMSWDAWRELPNCVRTGKTGLDSLGIEDAFGYLREHPVEAKIFNNAMTQYSHQSAPAIANAYDFSRFRKVVDVAGGHGFLLTTVLERYPTVQGVLFDMPHVIEGAGEAIRKSPAAARCETAAGDFFQSVPQGADAYMMKHIIHDWDDERAAIILRNCHRAMAHDGRLLVADMVIPRGNEPFYGKLLDLEMLVLPGGKERTEDEFRSLFAASGFELLSITPTAAPVSVVEGRPIR
jgi:SAM-dependent methyltransferase